MSTYDIQKIELPNGDICNIKLTADDTGAVAKVGDTMNGSLTVLTSSAPLILKHSTVDSTDVVQENNNYSLITFKDKNNLMTGEIGIHYCLDGANELRWKIYNYSSDGNKIDINQPVLRAFLKKDSTVEWGIASPEAFRSAIGTNYKTYTSVADLNLTVSSATILDAYNAMGTNSILICPITDFASSEAPTIDGTTVTQATVEIIRANANGRGYIHCYGKTPTAYDWRMFLLQNNSPTGTWVRTDDVALSLAADSGTNQLTLTAKYKYKLTVGAKTFIFTMPETVSCPYSIVKGTNPSNPLYYMQNYGYEQGHNSGTEYRLGGIEGNVGTNGISKFWLRAYKFISGSEENNTLGVGIDKNGNCSYTVTDPVAFRTAIDAVCRSGDTMTSPLNFSSTIDLSVRPSANDQGITRLQYLDIDGNVIGGIRETHQKSDGAVYNKIITRRTVNGNVKVCELGSGVSESGDYIYKVSSPEAFRTAISMDWYNRTATIHSGNNISNLNCIYQRNDALGLVYIQFRATIAKAINAHASCAALSTQSGDRPTEYAVGSAYVINNNEYYDCKLVKNNSNDVVAIAATAEALPIGGTLYGEIMWRI